MKKMKSWLDTTTRVDSSDSDFSIYNLPLGVYSISIHSDQTDTDTSHHHQTSTRRRRIATRLGDTLIDLGVLESALLFDDIPGLAGNTFNNQQSTLNAFMAHPYSVWKAFRQRLLSLLIVADESNDSNDTTEDDTHRIIADDRLFRNPALQAAAFIPYFDCNTNNDHTNENMHPPHVRYRIQLHLPWHITEYTDFYASREHATNVGTMFRGAAHALQPNWLHMPVGYHGRASTMVVSGTPVQRPCGQIVVVSKQQQQDKDKDTVSQSVVYYGASQKLDMELEVATIVGGPANALASSLTMADVKQRIFGYVLMNDWSARDIQQWEYVPLGPFTSKNFCTTISPWIVMAVALEDSCMRVSTSSASQHPTPLPYLIDDDYSAYPIDLHVALTRRPSRASKSSNNNNIDINNVEKHTICRSSMRNLYWTPAQQLVHHSVTGCVMRPGDVLGSGTISGSTPDSYGSLLELTWNGTQPLPPLPSEKTNGGGFFLQDGDTVTMTGACAVSGEGTTGCRIGFGECTGTIIPARPFCSSSSAMTATTDTSNETSALSLPSSSPEVANCRYSDFCLYGYWRSSSTWRVRIQLAAKQIPYTYVPINLAMGEHKTRHFLNKNPLGQVPFLECSDSTMSGGGGGGGQTLSFSQSLAMCTFLDAVFPDRVTLLPLDPVDRACALEMIEVINAGTQPLQNLFYLQRLHDESQGNIVVMDQAKRANETGLAALEVLVVKNRKLLRERLINQEGIGPYCLGTFAPSLVDAFMVPQLYNARRFGVELDALVPTLVSIEQECLNHPWFQTTHPERQVDAAS